VFEGLIQAAPLAMKLQEASLRMTLYRIGFYKDQHILQFVREDRCPTGEAEERLPTLCRCEMVRRRIRLHACWFGLTRELDEQRGLLIHI
jgi:hypothetical protein